MRLAAGLFAAAPVRAAIVSYTGSFQNDNDVQPIPFRLDAAATVQAWTLGYTGGTNGTGLVVPAGGLDPLLSLFAASGELLAIDNDAQVVVPNGNAPPQPWDAWLTVSLAPGDYLLALTQSDNSPVGPGLADGFLRDGDPNFTFAFALAPGATGFFWDQSGQQRDAFWALDLLLPDRPLPEPGSLVLLAASLFGLALRRRGA